MAVMNKMRDLTKSILLVLVFCFVGMIVFEWGMSYSGRSANATAIGEVDGVEIDAKQYDLALRRQIDQYRQQTGGEVNDTQIGFIRDQVWEALVRDVLIQKSMQENNISVANSEIIYRLFKAPPEVLRSNPSFQDENQQFDMAKYQAAINDPSLTQVWGQYEDYLRQNIPYEKFQDRLVSLVRVTDEEVRNEYLVNNESAKVEYVFFNPRSFSIDDITVSDENIAAYYKANKDDYKQDEQRAIQFVVLSTLPTAQDSADIREQALKRLHEAQSGDDFAELAETFSEDVGSRDKGGDLGYFARGAMVKPFEEAAFSAEIGAVVGPVESQFGLHIIKVEDKRLSEKDAEGKRKEEVNARHILFKFAASTRTANRVRDTAEYLAENAKVKSFAALAKELDDSVKTSNTFVKGSGFIPGVGVNVEASNFIFRAEIGEVGPVAETNNGLLVYKVSQVLPESIKPLNDVKPRIKNKLETDARLVKAEKMAEKVSANISSGKDFSAAAAEDSLEVKLAESVKRAGFIKDIGRDPQFIGAVFSLKATGDVTPTVKGARGYYLIKLLDKTAIDEAGFAKEKEGLRQSIAGRKRNQILSDWYAHEKSLVEVKDYRNRFYN